MATLTRESRVWRIRGLLHRRVGVSLWRPDGGVVVLSAETAGSALSAFTHCGRSRAVSRRELRGSRLAAGCADPAGAFAPDTTDYGWIARITSFAAWMMVGGVARQRPLVNPWPGLEPDKPGGSSPAWRGGQASGVSMPLQRFWMVSQELGRTPRKHRRPRRAAPRRLSWVWLEGCRRCRGLTRIRITPGRRLSPDTRRNPRLLLSRGGPELAVGCPAPRSGSEILERLGNIIVSSG
jgi:hypothetical protein